MTWEPPPGTVFRGAYHQHPAKKTAPWLWLPTGGAWPFASSFPFQGFQEQDRLPLESKVTFRSKFLLGEIAFHFPYLSQISRISWLLKSWRNMTKVCMNIWQCCWYTKVVFGIPKWCLHVDAIHKHLWIWSLNIFILDRIPLYHYFSKSQANGRILLTSTLHWK